MLAAELSWLVPIAGQALAALLLTVLLVRFDSAIPKSYSRQWIRSWIALASFHIAVALNLLLASSHAAAHPYRLILSVVAVSSLLFQAGFLLWGTWELATRRQVKLKEGKILLLCLLGAGVTAPLLLLAFPDEVRFQVTLPAAAQPLLVAGALVTSVVLLRRLRGIEPPFLVFNLSCLAWGAIELIHFAFSLSAISTGSTLAHAGVLAIAGVFVEVAAGMGMIISVLEDDREAALLAASQVEHIAYHDPLTGLPNRSLFFDRLVVALAQSNRHQYKLAVLFLDLDRFKQINDSLGHSTGDNLLKIAADRLRRCVREEDTVARFGGDEFVVLIHIIARAEDAGKIARKILDALGAPFQLGDRELVVSTSVGITVYPSDGADAETLVKNADTAMYRAKNLGGDNYQFYTAAMNSRALEMLELESGLRRAVKCNELSLYYQPLIDLRTGAISGNEALLRWNHPQLGVLLPERFLQTAEVSGLIIPIGNWVLREACRQAKFWQRQKGADLFVAVNLSARQFYQADLVEQVRAALEEARLQPKHLELEVTETNAMRDVTQTVRILNELKALGVRIAIDDFGTGYSSLSYLKEFPVDTLKLDQSFLRDLFSPQDSKLVSGVIALAHNMNFQVLAEGVETLGQLDFLRKNNCDRLQGFLFSRPLPAESFDRFWNNHKNFSMSA